MITLHANGTIEGLNNNNFKSSMPTGSVLQFVSAKKLDTQSTDSTSFVDLTDLSCTITPISSSSKIYITGSLNVNKENYTALFGLFRGSTEIGLPQGTGGSNHLMNVYTQDNNGSWRASWHWDDSPNTISAVTYQLKFKTDGGSDPTVHVGGHHDNTSSYTTPSYMTVMEIAA